MWCRKLVSDFFLNNQNWAYLLITVKNFLQFVLLYAQVEGYRNILKLKSRTLFFISCKVFLKTKSGVELVSLSHFLNYFLRKMFIKTLLKQRVQQRYFPENFGNFLRVWETFLFTSYWKSDLLRFLIFPYTQPA